VDLLGKTQPRIPLPQPLGGQLVRVQSHPQLRRALLDQARVRHEPVHERTAEPLLLMARVHRQAAHAIILQVRVAHQHGRGDGRALRVLDPQHMLNVQRPNRRLRHPRRSKVHRVQRLRELRRPAVKPLVVRPILAQHLDAAEVSFAMRRGLCCCGRAVGNGSHRRG
jgi:hypothetical protein